MSTKPINIFEDANDEDILWRFMDLSKFLDLLVNQSLTLARPDLFEDVYEGNPDLITSEIINPDTDNLETFNFLKETNRKVMRSLFYRSYISCWHLNPSESAAMWKLYCTSNESIAVKTTVAKLKESLNFSNNKIIGSLLFGKIIYEHKEGRLKDLGVFQPTSETYFPFTNCFFMKRPSFEHEKEYRILGLNKNALKITEDFEKSDEQLKSENPVIAKIDCNAESLIGEVVISPYAGRWFHDVVKKTTEKLGYEFDFTQSKLYELD